MSQQIWETCSLFFGEKSLIIMYEYNIVCTTQLQGWYIKQDRIKHISPKLFFTHDFQKNDDIDLQHIDWNNNLTDLLTKTLLT